MTDERLSVEELLESQSQQSLRATIEAVEGNDTMVKVTPWLKSAGCLCQFALTIPKASVKSVTPTGEQHDCCGNVLRVVQIDFADDNPVSLSDVFAQVTERASTRQGAGHETAITNWMAPPLQAFQPPAAMANWMTPPLQAFQQPFAQLAPFPPTRIQRCAESYAQSLASCVVDAMWSGDTSAYQECACNARNRYCACSRQCVVQQCPVSQ